jgi:SHS2 domain-containing protein
VAGPTWETFEHEADVGLVVRAGDGPGLFATAGKALFSLVCELERVDPSEAYELSGQAADVGALLVDWLNDLVWVVQGLGAVSSEFRFEEWSETGYRGAALGEPIDAERHAFRDVVKAATYHGLDVRRTEKGYEARVILDV